MTSPVPHPLHAFPRADRIAPPEAVADEIMRLIGRTGERYLISETSAAVFGYEGTQPTVVRVSTDAFGSRERLARGIEASTPFFHLPQLRGILFPSIPGAERFHLWGRTGNAMEKGRLVVSLDEIEQLGVKLGRLHRFDPNKLLIPEAVGYVGANGPHREVSLSHHSHVERQGFVQKMRNASKSEALTYDQQQMLTAAVREFERLDAWTRADFLGLLTKYPRRGLTHGDSKLDNGLVSLGEDFVAWADADYLSYALQVVDLGYVALSSPLSKGSQSPDRQSFEAFMRGFRTARGRCETNRLAWREAVALSLPTRLWWTGEEFQVALDRHPDYEQLRHDGGVWNRIALNLEKLTVIERCAQALLEDRDINDDASGAGAVIRRNKAFSGYRSRSSPSHTIMRPEELEPWHGEPDWRYPAVTDLSAATEVTRTHTTRRVVGVAHPNTSAEDFARLLGNGLADALVLSGSNNPPTSLRKDIPLVYWCSIDQLASAYDNGAIPEGSNSSRIFVDSNTYPDLSFAIRIACAVGAVKERGERYLLPVPLGPRSSDVHDAIEGIIQEATKSALAAWKNEVLTPAQLAPMFHTYYVLRDFYQHPGASERRFGNVPEFGVANTTMLDIRDRRTNPRNFAIGDFCMDRHDVWQFRDRLRDLLEWRDGEWLAEAAAIALAVDIELRDRLELLRNTVHGFANDRSLDSNTARVGPLIMGNKDMPSLNDMLDAYGELRGAVLREATAIFGCKVGRTSGTYHDAGAREISLWYLLNLQLTDLPFRDELSSAMIYRNLDFWHPQDLATVVRRFSGGSPEAATGLPAGIAHLIRDDPGLELERTPS